MQAQCPALAAQMTWQPLPLGRACQRGQPAQVARCALTHQPPLTISVLVKICCHPFASGPTLPEASQPG